MHILVAEDEAAIQELLYIVLGTLGHTCDIASNGQKAWELFSTQPEEYRLVITDRQMPALDGEALAKLVKSAGNTPVIMLTAYGELMNHVDEIPDGVDVVVAKPFSLVVLESEINLLTTPGLTWERIVRDPVQPIACLNCGTDQPIVGSSVYAVFKGTKIPSCHNLKCRIKAAQIVMTG